MIQYFIVQNRQGKTRLAKWYTPFSDAEKVKITSEIHRITTSREAKFTNIVEFGIHKVAYRRYAGLFFSLCIEANDNELAALESIHLFVEVLDMYFHSVCELDLVFHFSKVFAALDEVFLAGEIMETNRQLVVQRLEEQDKLD